MALLACARIGAIHSVIFGGFAAQAISDRVNDSACRLVLTQDGSYRRGAEVKLKTIVDEAVAHVPARSSTSSSSRPHRLAVAMQPGRDLWWHEQMARRRRRPAPCEPMDVRRPALPALHQRHHRQAQGPPAHHRRLRRPDLPDRRYIFDLKRRRRLLVHGRHRLDHRPQLRRLRPAAQRRHRPHVRRRAQLARKRPLLEDRRRPQGHRLLHRPHRHPRLHQVGRRLRAAATRSPRSACSAPSASPSTPEPGCGITARSATTAAPLSTPGGRPKPAPSSSRPSPAPCHQARLRHPPLLRDCA